jgi:hypothetical protein
VLHDVYDLNIIISFHTLYFLLDSTCWQYSSSCFDVLVRFFASLGRVLFMGIKALSEHISARKVCLPCEIQYSSMIPSIES